MAYSKRIYIIIDITAVILGGLFLVDPSIAVYAPKCPMKLITGLSCPACGIQRFLHALLHGEPMAALRYNYYLAFSLPYALLFIVEWAMPHGKRRDALARVIEHRCVVWFYIITFFIWMIVRNILGI